MHRVGGSEKWATETFASNLLEKLYENASGHAIGFWMIVSKASLTTCIERNILIAANQSFINLMITPHLDIHDERRPTHPLSWRKDAGIPHRAHAQ